VPAGCHPVRLALSAQGDVAYVTARKSNALLAFDTAKLVGDSTHAGIGSVPVGPAPVGVTVGHAGGRDIVIVGNSNRFAAAAGAADSLSVIDAARVGAGAGAVIGRIPAGRFPRELLVIDHGRTLVVTNFLSDVVELVDLERMSRSWPQR
jgi:DNA-binding beta-propeller fold protein YncE